MERSIKTRLIAVLVSLLALATAVMGLTTGIASAEDSQYLTAFNTALAALDSEYDAENTEYANTVLTDAEKAKNVVLVFDNYKVIPTAEKNALSDEVVEKYTALAAIAYEAYEVRTYAVSLFDYYKELDGKEVTYSMNDTVTAYRARYNALSEEELAFVEIWNAYSHFNATEEKIVIVKGKIRDAVAKIDAIYYNTDDEIVLNSITSLNTAKTAFDKINKLDYKYLYEGNDDALVDPLVNIPAAEVNTATDKKFVYDEAWADYDALLEVLSDLSEDIDALYAALTTATSEDYGKYWTNKDAIDALEERYLELDEAEDNNMKAKFNTDYATSVNYLFKNTAPKGLTVIIDELIVRIANVNGLIDAIGVVAYTDVKTNSTTGTLGINDDTYKTPKATYKNGTSFKKIAAARDAFNALDADIIAHDDAVEEATELWVEKYFTLLAAEETRNAQINAVLNVIDLIDAIADAADTQAAALTARNAYNALTATQKLDVDNYSSVPGLQYWEAKVANLIASAQNVDTLIAAIPAIAATEACKNAINVARGAYEAHVAFVEEYSEEGVNINGYTEDNYYGVTLYNYLVEAEAQYVITAADVIAWTDAVDAIVTPVTYLNWDLVAAAEEVFANLDPEVYNEEFLNTNYHDTYDAYKAAITARDTIKDAADGVIEDMGAIVTTLDEIELGDADYITAVQGITAAYEALGTTDEDKAAAKAYVQAAEEAYANYLVALELIKVVDVEAVIIDAIGDVVTLDTDLSAAAAAYDALSDENKALVRNYAENETEEVDTYEEAVAAKLAIAESLEELMDAVDALYDPDNTLEEGVHFTIETADVTSLHYVDLAAILDLQAAYADLVNDQPDAETRIAYLEDSYALAGAMYLRGIEVVEDLADAIDTLPAVFADVTSANEIVAIRVTFAAYDALSASQKALGLLTNDVYDFDGDEENETSRVEKVTALYNMVITIDYFENAANGLYYELTKEDAVATMDHFVLYNLIKSYYGNEGLGAFIHEYVKDKVEGLEAAWMALVDTDGDGEISEEELAKVVSDAGIVAKLDALTTAIAASGVDVGDINDTITVIQQTIAALDAAYQAADAGIITAYQAAIADLQGKIDALNTKAAALEGKDADIEDAIATINTAIAGLEADMNAGLAALDTAYKAADQAINTAIAGLTADLGSIDVAYKAADQIINASIATLDNSLNQALAAILTLGVDCEAADALLDQKISDAITAYEAADSTLTAKINALEEKVDNNYVELNKKIVIVAVVLGVINAALIACVIVLFVKKRA